MLRLPRTNPRPQGLHQNPSGLAVALGFTALGAVGGIGYLLYRTKTSLDKAVAEGKIKRVEKKASPALAATGKGFVKVEPPWLPSAYDPAAWKMVEAWDTHLIYKISADRVLAITPKGAYACMLFSPKGKTSKLMITERSVPMSLEEYKKVIKFLPREVQDTTMPWIETSYAVERPDGSMPGWSSGSAPPYIPTKEGFEKAIARAGGNENNTKSIGYIIYSIGYAAGVLK